MGLYYMKVEMEDGEGVIVSNNKEKLEKYAEDNDLDFHNRIKEAKDLVVTEADGSQQIVFDEAVAGGKDDQSDVDSSLSDNLPFK